MSNLPLINLVLSSTALLLSAFNVYWHFFRRPRLQVTYHDREPFRKYLISNAHPDAPEWYVRIKVLNTQKAIAKNCVGKIVEWHTDGAEVESFDPIKLHWVSKELDNYSGLDLSYQEFDYLDVIVTRSRQNAFIIYTNTHLRGIPLGFDLKKRHLFKVAIYSETEAFKFSWFLVERDHSEEARAIIVSQIPESQVGRVFRRA